MIGLFDSGLGGLTVVRELERVIPHVPIVYLGDTARTPYGTKSRETIKEYAAEDTRFLLDHGAQAIVIACNTVSAVARDVVERISSVPVFDVVRPAVEAAFASGAKRIGVVGTRATVESSVYETLLHKRGKAKVFSQSCPLLVPLVEEGELDHPATRLFVQEYCDPLLREGIDALILGCTHYPLLLGIFRSVVGPSVKIINPADVLAETVRSSFDNAAAENAEPSRFFFTDVTPASHDIAQMVLGRDIRFERVVLT
jgi:glutamate racemase